MASRAAQTIKAIGRGLRDTLSALAGDSPDARAKDGAYGTLRAQSRQLDSQRRDRYPSD